MIVILLRNNDLITKEAKNLFLQLFRNSARKMSIVSSLQMNCSWTETNWEMNMKDPLSPVRLSNLEVFYTRMNSCVSCIRSEGSYLDWCFFLKLMIIQYFPLFLTNFIIIYLKTSYQTNVNFSRSINDKYSLFRSYYRIISTLPIHIFQFNAKITTGKDNVLNFLKMSIKSDSLECNVV